MCGYEEIKFKKIINPFKKTGMGITSPTNKLIGRPRKGRSEQLLAP
jgi:hypothetical protein